MPGSAVYGFLTQADLSEWLWSISGADDLRFWIQLGATNENDASLNVTGLQTLCQNSTDRLIGPFLVGTGEGAPVGKKIALSDGSGWKIRRDPVLNPGFIELLVGRRSEAGILSVMFSSTNELALARQLFRSFKSSMRKKFKQVGGHFISDRAMELSVLGACLRTHAGESVHLVEK